MRWRARAGSSSRAKKRANISFFIFIIFFAVFGIIILTQLLLLERPSQQTRSRYDELQRWAAKTEKLGAEVIEPALPAKIPQDGVWQPVGGTRFRFYVYSAYVERRTVSAVRVIGATKTRGADPVVCKLWLPNSNRSMILKAKVQVQGGYCPATLDTACLQGQIVLVAEHPDVVLFLTSSEADIEREVSGLQEGGYCPATLDTACLQGQIVLVAEHPDVVLFLTSSEADIERESIRENWNLKYSAVYVLCLLRDSGVKPQDTVGATVAVLSAFAPKRPPTNMLLVIDTELKPGTEKNLHVCVKPFHFAYHRAEWLLEWIEVNRLLGVFHFYMYNKSVSPHVECILKHYRDQGVVTLLPWDLPILSRVEIRTEGLFAAFNDCLYRSMGRAGWLMPIDTDELVFPRRDSSLPAMIANFSRSVKLPTKKPAAFLFRNVFFYTSWEDDPKAPAPLLTARKTRRLLAPLALKIRSKYVVRPRDIVELGNHFIWEHAPGASSVGVPTDIAILHHYRMNCEFDGVQCLKQPSAIDRTAHRWSKKLLARVRAKQKVLDNVCTSL